MGIATAPSLVSHNNSVNHRSWTNSMSQDYHQGIFNFSNGFERTQQAHIAQQIRRDKLRVQGFEPPPPLVGIDEEEAAGIQGFETAGMLSEMFNFQQGGAGTATELLENQILQSYRNSRAAAGGADADWFPHREGMAAAFNLGSSKNQAVVSDASPNHHLDQQQHQISNINADSAAAMQLFLINPQQQQQRSSSPSPSHPARSTASTLHMLLPNSASSSSTLQALPVGGHFGQFTWIPNSAGESNPNEIPTAVVEGQGLSLSLSSSLQHLEAAKDADELRIGEGGMLFFGQGAAGASNSAAAPSQSQYQFKNLSSGGGGGSGLSLSSFGSANLLRNSKYAKAAQELLEEFCSVGRNQFRKIKSNRQNNNSSHGENPRSYPASGGAGNSSCSSKDIPPLSAADRIEHQRRKVKLLSMLEEVERRYGHYCEQMQMVVNSFDMVMGFGAAVPYTCLAQKAMSRHFRCLKDAIAEQLKHSCEMLGEKDVGSLGVTKGETPRLRMLEQNLRQQRAFHQMGMMEQEAWRPQRGLPERSVNVLRAWLFEHFLNPYPSDADKHLLARQTGLSRNQVSNWFINARVRLWKPMIEEMYQQEGKEGPGEDDDQGRDHSSSSAHTQNHPATSSDMVNAGAAESDPSQTATFAAINRQCFMDNQEASRLLQHGGSGVSSLQPPPAAAVPDDHHNEGSRGYHPADIEATPTLIRFGTSGGDVSLTLGLRHAGNLPEKSRSPFSVREFGDW